MRKALILLMALVPAFAIAQSKNPYAVLPPHAQEKLVDAPAPELAIESAKQKMRVIMVKIIMKKKLLDEAGGTVYYPPDERVNKIVDSAKFEFCVTEDKKSICHVNFSEPESKVDTVKEISLKVLFLKEGKKWVPQDI